MSDHVVRDPIIDPARSACLCDVGAPGYQAVLAVDADGNTSLWIADTDLLGRDDVDHGAIPRHEQLGELPPHVRARLWRCGHPTETGQPCQLTVDELGGACALHRDRSGP
jgi:hypothetical protein